MFATLALDKNRETRSERMRFFRVRKAEVHYASRLREIARQVGNLVRGYSDGETINLDLSGLTETLLGYSRLIRPWARVTAARMLADVGRRDEKAWAEQAATMSRALRKEIATAPTGEVFHQLMEEQVTLITSLPTEAAERVHKLVEQGLADGTRASEYAKEIYNTGEVTRSRATLIARTEVGRAATSLVQARATHVASEGYIWQTAHDQDVRPSHKKMQSKFVRWDDPPTLDNLTGHAGALPNCRCWPEPVIPDVFT